MMKTRRAKNKYRYITIIDRDERQAELYAIAAAIAWAMFALLLLFGPYIACARQEFTPSEFLPPATIADAPPSSALHLNSEGVDL